MGLSNDKKKDMLLQSFNVLKSNIENHSDKIKEIIGKMSKLDLQTAIEMWEFVLGKGKNLIHDSSKAYRLCGGIIYDLEQAIGKNAVMDIIESNGMIRKNVYGQSGDICCSTYCSAKKFIEINNIELANEIITYFYENKYKSQTFAEILEQLCDFNVDEIKLSPDTVEMLLSWSEKLNDEEEKARIMVTLTDYI